MLSRKVCKDRAIAMLGRKVCKDRAIAMLGRNVCEDRAIAVLSRKFRAYFIVFEPKRQVTNNLADNNIVMCNTTIRGDLRMAYSFNEHGDGSTFTESLSENIGVLKAVFADVDPIKYREIETAEGCRFCLVYFDGLVDSSIIDNHIIKPLMLTTGLRELTTVKLAERVIQLNSASVSTDLDEIIGAVCYGDSLLLTDGSSETLLMDTKGFALRSIAEPDGEKILSGPREGFSEAMLINLSMLRRKLRTNDLKMKYYSLGERSKTALCVAYIEGIAKPEVVAELYRRLDAISIDGVLDSNYVTEFIRDNRRSVFRTTGYTERPDVVAGKILEGRVAVFVDGSPVALTVPYLFIENFQSNEDYYLSFYYTSFSRFLRILGFLMTITVPALYISLVSFHHELLPAPLIIRIATESHNMPMPTTLEAVMMLLIFDILRETGIRMPAGVGQTLGILGAIVIGQAAVEASLVSSTMIIVVAMSGITSLLIPKLNAPIIVLRSALLLLSSMFGFFGLTLGLAVAFIHVLNLESFGMPQVMGASEFRFRNLKDIFIRAPWWRMVTRPAGMSRDAVRMKSDGKT